MNSLKWSFTETNVGKLLQNWLTNKIILVYEDINFSSFFRKKLSKQVHSWRFSTSCWVYLNKPSNLYDHSWKTAYNLYKKALIIFPILITQKKYTQEFTRQIVIQ